jgi:hypothetical protein
MMATDLCAATNERQAPSSDPVLLTEAVVRQAEIEAAYLAVEAGSADPVYRAWTEAKAAEACDRARRLRAAIRSTMPRRE